MTFHFENRPLAGRVAVVTGASAGIGTEVARLLARCGASVVVNARRRERLDGLVKEIEGLDARAIAVAGDAAEQPVIDSMLDASRELAGGNRSADLVVANAGRGLRGSPLTSNIDEWEEMIRINYVGAARLLRAAAERMIEDGPDPAEDESWHRTARDIVVVSSNVGKHISPFSSMYGSSKFAITSICEAARRELAPRGIRVTGVHPGIVKTEFQEVAGYDPVSFGRFMDSIAPVLGPKDVADVVGFVVTQPAGVHVNDIVVRPTRQEYP